MFKNLLENLSKVSVALNGRIEEDGDQLINTMIFGSNFTGDVMAYKKVYFRKLRVKEIKILKIQEEVYRETLTEQERKILLQEIENRLLKLEFLRFIYSTEAQKINPDIQVYYPYSIDIYNKAFFGVTKKDVVTKTELKSVKSYENIYKKSDLLMLIKKAKALCPEMQFRFGLYPNFSHRSGLLKIPNQKYYNIQNIITLFFHETTHFFRTFNGERNLGFAFQFSGYSTLEEGIAIYNEYHYGNKIIDYGNFQPYYNLCIEVLLRENLSEAKKKEKICHILSHKGFDEERASSYYNRFYKYCEIGGTHVFLKDLIYYNGYKNVTKLIKQDSHNYEKIMAGDIGIQELQQGLIQYHNSYNHKNFFQHMLKEIKHMMHD